MSLYPLKFYPILKERIWGGRRLHDMLKKSISSDFIGESWELSAVGDDVSVVVEGELSGKLLTVLINDYGAELLGDEVSRRFGKEFPILIKFIDAKTDLSIQVHPDDTLAQARHGCNGKTEMWYIIDAKTQAKINVGFNKNLSREEYLSHLNNNTLTDLLHYEPIHNGEAYLIRAGTIHAIGGGTLLAEIQQTSDITYRVYDYNRQDIQGNKRELHTQEALDALCYEQKENYKMNYETHVNIPNSIVSTPYFKTDYLSVEKTMRLDKSVSDSFSILIGITGEGVVSNAFGKTDFAKGETLLLAANSKTINIIAPKGATLLHVYL